MPVLARFPRIATLTCICALALYPARADSPKTGIDLLRHLMFPSTPGSTGKPTLRLSKRAFVPVALNFSNPVERAVVAEQTFISLAGRMGIDVLRHQTQPPNFAIIYSRDTVKDIIVQYPAIRRVLRFGPQNDREYNQRTQYVEKDGTIIEDTCVMYTSWQSPTESKTALLVRNDQPDDTFRSCLTKAFLSHIGFVNIDSAADRELLSENGRQLRPEILSLLRRLANPAFSGGMTEAGVLSAWKQTTGGN